MERLEPRRQMAVTASLSNGEYLIVSDAASDTINVKLENHGGIDFLLLRDARNEFYTNSHVPAKNVQRIMILGGDGNDVIDVSAFDAKLVPSLKQVTIYGGNGNDILTGSRLGDTIDGGDGNDLLFTGSMTKQIIEPIYDVLYGGDGDDDIFGNDGWYVRLTVYGGNGNDRIWGNTLDDVFYGEAGNDILYPAGGNDYMDGGIGDDSYYYSSTAMGQDVAVDIAGNDTLNISGLRSGMWADLRVFGHDKNEDSLITTKGMPNPRCLFFQEYENSIENIVGTEFDDVLFGNDDVNFLSGQGGNDVFYGFGGGDVLMGDLGDDVYMFTGGVAANAPDEIAEGIGRGNDTLDFSAYAAGVVVDLAGMTAYNANSGQLIVKCSPLLGLKKTQIENIVGSSLNDALYGNELNNQIWGGAGNDVLWGGRGGSGLLAGGAGDDHYYFTNLKNPNDFVTVSETLLGGNDILDLRYYTAADAIIANLPLNSISDAETELLIVAIDAINNSFESVLGTTMATYYSGNE